MFKSKLIALTLLCTYSLTGCGVIIHGSKAKLALLNAPNDLEVTNVADGEKLRIQTLSVDASKAGNVTTFYMAPAVRVKVKKGLTLQFKSGNVSKTQSFGYKNNIGFLVIETLFTLGIGTAIDLITGANREFKPKYINVNQLLKDSATAEKPKLKADY